MEKAKKTNRTRWHRLLGKLLELLLTPTNVTVLTDVQVMSNPPETDILLIRRDQPRWTRAQLQRLPDGIRDSLADHILIEFKYDETVGHAAAAQALGYDTFYRRTHDSLASDRIQTFLLSSRTPAGQTRSRLGYNRESKPGVYHSSNTLLKKIPLISINQLSDAPCNDYVKCFASRKAGRRSLFNVLETARTWLDPRLYHLAAGLISLLSVKAKGGLAMEHEYTPEHVMEIGKELHAAFLAGVDIDEILPRFEPEDVLSRYGVEERLAGLKPEERLSGLRPEERLSGLKIEEIEQYLEKLTDRIRKS